MRKLGVIIYLILDVVCTLFMIAFGGGLMIFPFVEPQLGSGGGIGIILGCAVFIMSMKSVGHIYDVILCEFFGYTTAWNDKLVKEAKRK